MTASVLAVVGGSGLYDLDDLRHVATHRQRTPFGDPSGPIVEGEVGGTRVLFLPRHGIGHTLTPSEVNYRANIYALKALGATHVLSVSAVGSLREHIAPGDMVIPHQYIDRTAGRKATFFGDGVVAHVMFADPVCPELTALIANCVAELGYRCHSGGTLVTMEGPAFSTRAESHMHRQWGADAVGMTAMPEAKLAREAELCYATLALATDYDCWKEDGDDVSVEEVVATLRDNVAKAKSTVRAVAGRLGGLSRACACPRALDNAIITQPAQIPQEIKERLRPIAGRVL